MEEIDTPPKEARKALLNSTLNVDAGNNILNNLDSHLFSHLSCSTSIAHAMTVPRGTAMLVAQFKSCSNFSENNVKI